MSTVSVESSDHFKQLLEQDLDRVSCLYFRADWAEPCAETDKQVADLAAKQPSVLFLKVSLSLSVRPVTCYLSERYLNCQQIEAEALSEVSESFDVESVPHFVLLRGHSLLDTITGSQPSVLASAIEKHTKRQKSANPTSSSTNQPRPASPVSSSKYSQDPPPDDETEEQLTERCNKLMNMADVVLFMKGNPDEPRCGFSNQTVKLLRSENTDFKSFDILQDESVRQRAFALLVLDKNHVH